MSIVSLDAACARHSMPKDAYKRRLVPHTHVSSTSSGVHVAQFCELIGLF